MGFPSSCELAESRWSVVAACPIPWQFQSSLLRAAKNTNRDYVNRIRSSRYKMPATIYYDNDADLSLLKDKTIAILGYGSQGHAQAQNLRDSGCNVIVGQRPGSPNYDLAVSHGFEPMPIDEATKRGDLINILLPDEVQGDIFKDHILKNLSEGDILMCSHGF
ncbi:MAG: NAD(P)-dependent oxidoreductase, partial [Pirellulaceae bacterium]|nr:NAD(P)-dependent oxidoreductase [Pirellulaceae bacterium]